MRINLEQARELVEAFGGDEDMEFELHDADEFWHSGPGLYLTDDYSEHGAIFLGEHKSTGPLKTGK